jgi:hypothetical protein
MPLEIASKFKTEGVRVTATAPDASAQLVYQCPPNFSAIIRLLNIASGAVHNKTIAVQFYHVEDSTYHYLLNDYTMTNNNSFNVLNAGIMSMHQNDKIVAHTNSASNFDIIISVEEYFDPVRR